jgi:hypothetical protein
MQIHKLLIPCVCRVREMREGRGRRSQKLTLVRKCQPFAILGPKSM